MEGKNKARWSMSWVAGLLLLLPFLLILPNLNSFPFPPQPGAYSDLAVTHYPLTTFLRQELIEFHRLPLWSPTILSGTPFFANPLSGMMYPPGWLALVLPLPAGFNILAMLHLLWGGLGMLLLLRSNGLSFASALLGSLSFELMPKLIAHYGAGHLTLIYAVSWTPWLLWTWKWREDNGPRNKERPAWRRFLPGLVLALVFLADVRWGIYAIGLLWIYAIAHSYNRLGTLKVLFLQSMLSMLLAAPLIIPLMEYTNLSTRSMMTASDVLIYSLPPARLLGLVFPSPGGNYEWTLYQGAMIVCLGMAATVCIRAGSVSRFWIGIAISTLLFSMGSAIPGVRFLAALPGLSLLRVPSRLLFLTGISMSVLASRTFDAMLNGLTDRETRRVRLLFVALASFAVAIALSVRLLAGSFSFPFVWGAAAFLAASLWLGWGTSELIKKHRHVWITGLFFLCLVDLGIAGKTMITFRPSEEVTGEGAAAADWLEAQPGIFRVYSPSYSLPQQTAARAKLQLADGIDPLQMVSYAIYMERATGVTQQGYSVTMPPFSNGVPSTANIDYLPNVELLGELNVRYIAADFDVLSEGLVLKKRFGNIRVYENRMALPRAWVQSNNSIPAEDVRPAQAIDWEPNRITAEADGPGLFVLSEIFYPGWRVWVDGNRQNVEAVGGLLRGVSLEPGRHRIIFAFLPTSLYLGLLMCFFGLGLIFWAIQSARFR